MTHLGMPAPDAPVAALAYEKAKGKWVVTMFTRETGLCFMWLENEATFNRGGLL